MLMQPTPERLRLAAVPEDLDFRRHGGWIVTWCTPCCGGGGSARIRPC